MSFSSIHVVTEGFLIPFVAEYYFRCTHIPHFFSSSSVRWFLFLGCSEWRGVIDAVYVCWLHSFGYVIRSGNSESYSSTYVWRNLHTACMMAVLVYIPISTVLWLSFLPSHQCLLVVVIWIATILTGVGLCVTVISASHAKHFSSSRWPRFGPLLLRSPCLNILLTTVFFTT